MSVGSLLVHRSTICLCVLVFYLVTVLNSLISSRGFLVISWDFFFFTQTTMPSANMDRFIPFQIVFLFKFPFLPLMHRLEVPVSCLIGMMSVDIFALLLEEKHSVFHH